MERISRGRFKKSALALALLLTMVSGLAAGAGIEQSPRTASAGSVRSGLAQAEPEFCSDMPRGQDFSFHFNTSGIIHNCSVTNLSRTREWDQVAIEKHPDVTRARQRTEDVARPHQELGEVRTATSRFGDAGYGWELSRTNNTGNLDAIRFVFARQCYVAFGGATRYGSQDRVDPSSLRTLMQALDTSVQRYPCASTPNQPTPPKPMPTAQTEVRTDVVRIIRSTDPPCDAKEAGYIDDVQLPDGHDPNKVFVEMDDQGNLLNPDQPYHGALGTPLYGGDMILTPPYDTEMDLSKGIRVTARIHGTAIMNLEPGTAFTIPCDSVEEFPYWQLTPKERKMGRLEILVKFVKGELKNQPRYETKDAVTAVKDKPCCLNLNLAGGNTGSETLFTTAVADPFPDPDLRFIVDDRSGTGTTFIVITGSLQITPTNSSLRPFTLDAGQQAQVSQTNISPVTSYTGVPGSSTHTFPETGKAVNGLFLQYWKTHGGLTQQGFPISELMREKSDLNGQTYTVQYFERAVFEFHPEYAPPNDVLLSQLGTFQYKRKYPNGAPNQRPNNSPGSRLFPETGKRVGGKFLDYWTKNGGLAQQGLPLSDEFTEVSETDGKTYLVQYFERAVFEHHPENVGKPSEVLLSLLGVSFHKQKYGGGQPPTTVAVPQSPTPTRPPQQVPPTATRTSVSGPPPGQPTSTPNLCADIPPPQNMRITPTNCARAGSSFSFVGSGFNAGERVGVYATGPNGQVIGAEFQVIADQNGNTSTVTLNTQAGSPQGVWALTMEGISSSRRAIGYIRVLPP